MSPYCIALLSERSSTGREISYSEVSCIYKDEQQGLTSCGLSERPEIFSANLDPTSLKYLLMSLATLIRSRSVLSSLLNIF